jgi:hypothetical protein
LSEATIISRCGHSSRTALATSERFPQFMQQITEWAVAS